MLLSGVLCLCQIEQPENTQLGTLFAPLFANTTRDIYYRQHAGMFSQAHGGPSVREQIVASRGDSNVWNQKRFEVKFLGTAWFLHFFKNLRSYFQGRFPGPLLITTYSRGPETRTVFRSCFQGRFSAIFAFFFSRARPERKPSCKLIGGGFGVWNSSCIACRYVW